VHDHASVPKRGTFRHLEPTGCCVKVLGASSYGGQCSGSKGSTSVRLVKSILLWRRAIKVRSVQPVSRRP
jgi:hypothetical protein